MSEYVSAELRKAVALDAGHRCGYCQTDERLSGVPLSVEHIIPKSLGGESVRTNLWMACRPCNEFKGSHINGVDPQTGERASLFNPRTQRWDDHCEWDETGTTINGLTATGRVTAELLQLHRPLLVFARKRWVLNNWHPPALLR